MKRIYFLGRYGYLVKKKISNFSLDIEGAELPVLRAIPWTKVNIRVILIEVIHFGKMFDGTKEEMQTFLEEKGYRLFKDVGFDQIYIKKDSAKIKKN
jgi:hypothetical protein